MGFHYSKEQKAMPWDPLAPFISRSCPTYLMIMMHLEHLAQLATHLHCTLGSWSMAQMGFCLTMADKRGFSSLFQPLQMGYMLVQFSWMPIRMIFCPHSHLGAPQVICLEIKGSSPSSLFLEPFYSFSHILDFIWPSNNPPSYHIIISALSRGLFFILWSYLVGLSTKECYFAHYF